MDINITNNELSHSGYDARIEEHDEKCEDENSDFLQRENLLRQRLFLSLKLKIEK